VITAKRRCMTEATASPMRPPVAVKQGHVAAAAALYCLSVLVIFNETAWSIVAVWLRSDTFAHGFLILPISLWLVWDKRHALARISTQRNSWVLALMLPVGFLWLVASLVNVLVVQQLAFVGMVSIGTWYVVGNGLAAILAFPLSFLFLGVPMGENLIPPMMEITAIYTVKLVQMTGIPVYREGLFFSLPSGNWSVVEACSGVRYLIASFTLGILYAFLTYRSPLRRCIFVLASIVVPVVANVLRAFMIVMLGHFSDMTVAVGVDHLIYGWIFFGVVMLLLFWLGSMWREDNTKHATAKERIRPLGGGRARQPGSPLVRTLVALLVVSIWPFLAYAMQQTAPPLVDAQLSIPDQIGEWHSAAEAQWRFDPSDGTADRQLEQYYQSGDRVVGLHLAQYLDQRQGAELVSTIGQYVGSGGDWRLVSKSRQPLVIGDTELAIDQVHLASGGRHILLWTWYRIGASYTANPYQAKALEALGRLGLGRRDAARVTLETRFVEGEETARVLRAFLVESLPAIEASLDDFLVEGQL
jgi:exosortase A